MDSQQLPQPSSNKLERKIVEKNRRNQMKNLCSQLYSLLPNQEAMSVGDQIDEAINYIKSLQARMKMAQKKKERLMETKRSRSGCSSASEAQRSLKLPRIETHETGSSLEVILTCGVDNQFIFREIIRILHEENVEVISTNSSIVGDSMLHVVHGEVRQSFSQFGATSKVSEKLKRFVHGSISDMEMESELGDFEIGTADLWEILTTLDTNEGLPPNLLQN
ncbi:hypothetical protein Fmac_019266 [Flemingia macrophylla]|uniref:BHLH domain-containing protein n=1 Tax=Flemingia macrophylla TaxID=520843 RepID=A0ABD1M996_9FABA